MNLTQGIEKIGSGEGKLSKGASEKGASHVAGRRDNAYGEAPDKSKDPAKACHPRFADPIFKGKGGDLGKPVALITDRGKNDRRNERNGAGNIQKESLNNS